MRRLLCLIVLGLRLMGCSSAPAHDSAADEACTPATAVRGDIRTMIANPGQWMTKCVTIRGTAIGWRIYADVDALYRPISDWQKDSSNGGTLGLSGDPNDESQWPKDGELELTGTMQDCEAAHEMIAAENAANPDRFVMVGGYCHTSLGLHFMIEHTRRLGPLTLKRQLPERAGARYGDLEPAPRGWLLRQGVEQKASDFLAAVRKRDKAALSAMHLGYEYADGEPGEMEALLLRDADSPFARLRAGKPSPQLQMLVARTTGEDRSDYENDVDFWRPVICFCLVGDCTKLWPIRSADADNLPSRPYACTTVVAGMDNFQPAIWLDTPRAKIGLVEPKAR